MGIVQFILFLNLSSVLLAKFCGGGNIGDVLARWDPSRNGNFESVPEAPPEEVLFDPLFYSELLLECIYNDGTSLGMLYFWIEKHYFKFNLSSQVDGEGNPIHLLFLSQEEIFQKFISQYRLDTEIIESESPLIMIKIPRFQVYGYDNDFPVLPDVVDVTPFFFKKLTAENMATYKVLSKNANYKYFKEVPSELTLKQNIFQNLSKQMKSFKLSNSSSESSCLSFYEFEQGGRERANSEIVSLDHKIGELEGFESKEHYNTCSYTSEKDESERIGYDLGSGYDGSACDGSIYDESDSKASKSNIIKSDKTKTEEYESEGEEYEQDSNETKNFSPIFQHGEHRDEGQS